MSSMQNPKQPARMTVAAIRADNYKAALTNTLVRLEDADVNNRTDAQLIAAAVADPVNFEDDVRVLKNILMVHKTIEHGIKEQEDFFLDPFRNFVPKNKRNEV
jgi:hypothetical protein